MGWTFTYGASKKDIIAEITSPSEWTRTDGRRGTETTIAKCVRGNVLWTVKESTVEGEQPERWIGCYLLGTNVGDWGYKGMEESMHPHYYNCPVSYLDMAPVACQEWRDKVLAQAQKRNQKLKIGDRVSIVDSTVPWVEITSLKPLLGRYGYQTYRIPRRMLGDVISE